QEFWEDFADDGMLNDLNYSEPTARYQTDTGTLGVCRRLLPGESAPFVFYLCWYFPNRINGWNDEIRIEREGEQTVRNYYAQDFADAWDAALYLASEHGRLKAETRQFTRAVYDSALPPQVIEAAMN